MTESIPTKTSTGTPHVKSVRGVFHERQAVVRAVERLSEKSVPADSVRVFVRDETGERRREVEVEDESGALLGAFIGLVLGGILGLGIAIAVGTGAFGAADVGFLSFRGFAGAISAVLATAAAAVPLGALLGMGYWQGRKKIDQKELRSGSAEVVVESHDLSQLAESVLREAGAADVTVEAG